MLDLKEDTHGKKEQTTQAGALQFLESEKRFKWWQEHPLSGLYTLHKRPSFTGRGTDATSYSWFVWERGGPAA